MEEPYGTACIVGGVPVAPARADVVAGDLDDVGGCVERDHRLCDRQRLCDKDNAVCIYLETLELAVIGI